MHVLICLLVLALIGLACKATPNDSGPTATPTDEIPLDPSPPAGFQGEINGIQFGRDVDQPAVTSMSPKCNGRNAYDGDTQSVLGTGLDFEATYLPPSLRLTATYSRWCEDDVIMITKLYEGPNSSYVEIARKTGPPFYPSNPEQKLSAVQIGDRPGVVNTVGLPRSIAVYMRDEGTSWKIVGAPFEIGELLRVAEGAK